MNLLFILRQRESEVAGRILAPTGLSSDRRHRSKPVKDRRKRAINSNTKKNVGDATSITIPHRARNSWFSACGSDFGDASTDGYEEGLAFFYIEEFSQCSRPSSDYILRKPSKTDAAAIPAAIWNHKDEWPVRRRQEDDIYSD